MVIGKLAEKWTEEPSPCPHAPLLVAHDIRFSYGDNPVLNGMDVSLDVGTVLFLMGVNGCGKSTFIDCVLGSNRAQSGTLAVMGEEVGKLSALELAHRVAFVPQLHQQSFPYSVEHVVLMGRMSHMGRLGVPGRDDKLLVKDALERCGIAHLAERLYTTLSGGEVQMTLLARALVQQSPLIILDEPTAHLDFKNEMLFLATVERLVREGRHGVLMASHMPNHAFYLANAGLEVKLAVMQGGRVVKLASPHEALTPQTLLGVFGVEALIMQESYEHKGSQRQATQIAPIGIGEGSGELEQVSETKSERPLLSRSDAEPTPVPEMQSVIIAVDDTDDLTKETSTGEVAECIVKAAIRLGGREVLRVSRHQLLLDESVPYTSHNSVMVACLEFPVAHLDQLRACAQGVILSKAAPTADPGLCIACLPAQSVAPAATSAHYDQLLAFGIAATRRYCSQEEAYQLAAQIPWLELTAHGGDGQGVVGALAGVGLRLSGDDGRFRGGIDLAMLFEGRELGENGSGDGRGGGRGSGGARARGGGLGGDDGRGGARGGGGGKRANANDRLERSEQLSTVGEITSLLKVRLSGSVRIVDSEFATLPPKTFLRLNGNVKALLRGGAYTIVAPLDEGIANPLAKQDLDQLLVDVGVSQGDVSLDTPDAPESGKSKATSLVCNYFEPDNDPEECYDNTESTCRNCLYRRLESYGFTCTHVALSLQTDTVER